MEHQDVEAGPTEEQFQEMLQQAVLQHYPNPERKGCLDSETITTIARQRLPHQASGWEHISHCSPCYREFLNQRNRFLEIRNALSSRKRKLFLVSMFAAVGLLTLAAVTILRNR